MTLRLRHVRHNLAEAALGALAHFRRFDHQFGVIGLPRRLKLSERRVGWLLSELEQWLRERAAARDVGGGDAKTA